MVDPGKDRRLREFLARQHPDAPSSGLTLKAALDAAAASVAGALEEANIDALILKGPALDVLLYGQEGSRRYVDIDVLVSPTEISEAENVLGHLGYLNAGVHLGIDDVGGVVHADTWIRLQPDAITPQVELHRWFPGAVAPADEVWAVLWDTRTQISVAGRNVWVLDIEGQALQLAMHLAHHGPRYVRGAWELRLALERWPPEVWRMAAGLAHAVGAIETFATGLRLVDPSAEVLENLKLPSTTAMVWDAEHRDEFPRGVYFLEAIRETRGVARLHILRRALLPSPRWIVYNHGLNEPGRLRIGVAYAEHIMRAPWWAARAALFSRRRRRDARD